jgi:prepilin-type N-terminal cleavage/methylation domain-containing protein
MAAIMNWQEMRQKNGLTLIELLVVVLILGVLAAIAVPRFTHIADDAKERTCETNCDTINTQIELYYAETGSYPADITDITEDPNRFPDGPPECPKGGSYYINSENRAECDHSGGGPGC